MTRGSKVAVVAVFLTAALLLCSYFSYNKLENEKHSEHSVVVAGQTFSVALADTQAERQQGLSGHQKLKDNEGMLFVFEESSLHSFWMKDMLFPIDIVWIDESGKIVHIEENVSPSTYPTTFTPKKRAKYVLEILAGSVKALKITEGDVVRL